MRAVFCFMILFYGLFTSSSLFASNWRELMVQAEAYESAGDYDKAYQIYARLRAENLAPWQEARLLYNLGTLDLKQGNYEAALIKLKKVPELPVYDDYRKNNLNYAEKKASEQKSLSASPQGMTPETRQVQQLLKQMEQLDKRLPAQQVVQQHVERPW